MIKAVIFDLDDTLYYEIEYIKSGFRAVAFKLKNRTLYKKLYKLWREDGKNVFQRAGLSPNEIETALNTYREHVPTLHLKGSVKRTLLKLRRMGFRIGIITDGRPEGQRLKIEALGLRGLVDKIIITDELGGPEFRKPNPAAFQKMKLFFGLNYEEMIYVGDNLNKDFIAPSTLGMKTCFFFSKKGIYKSNAKHDTNFCIKRISETIKLLTGGLNEQ